MQFSRYGVETRIVTSPKPPFRALMPAHWGGRYRPCPQAYIGRNFTISPGPNGYQGEISRSYGFTTRFSNRIVRSGLLNGRGSVQDTIESREIWPPAFRVPRYTVFQQTIRPS